MSFSAHFLVVSGSVYGYNRGISDLDAHTERCPGKFIIVGKHGIIDGFGVADAFFSGGGTSCLVLGFCWSTGGGDEF